MTDKFDREAAIAEATDLGLTFPGNISNVKLGQLLDEYDGSPPAVQESAPPSPAAKAEPEEPEAEAPVARTAAQLRAGRRRKQIAAARGKAMRKHIVTLTNKDNRENDVATTAFLSFENQFFGMARHVPLDIPVELEEALIKIAASCTMILHKDEIIGGKRTGNKVPVKVKKYAISYSRQDPQ